MTNDIGFAPGLALAVLLVAAGGLVIHATRANRADLRFQLKLFVAAFAVRYAASILLYAFGLATVLGDDDASGWSLGATLANQWGRQNLGLLDVPLAMGEALKYQNRGYPYLLGGFFYLTGAPARLPAAALNCFFGALAVILIYRTARCLFSQWASVRVAWWSCLFPSLIVWSAMTIKEPVVILLESVAIYTCVRMHTAGPAPRYLLLCIASFILLLPFRFYAPFLLAPPVLLSLMLPGIGRLKSSIAAVVLVVVLGPIVFGTQAFLRSQDVITAYDLKQAEVFRDAASSGGAANGAGSGMKVGDLRTSDGRAVALAVGGAHLMLAPFPWELGGASTRMLLTLPELVIWWYLFFLGVVPGAIYCFRRRLKQTASLMLFVLSFGLVYSLMFANVGLIFRQRAQLLPWLLMFAAVGLEQRALRKRRQRAAVDTPGYAPVRPEMAPAPQTATS